MSPHWCESSFEMYYRYNEVNITSNGVRYICHVHHMEAHPIDVLIHFGKGVFLPVFERSVKVEVYNTEKQLVKVVGAKQFVERGCNGTPNNKRCLYQHEDLQTHRFQQFIRALI